MMAGQTKRGGSSCPLPASSSILALGINRARALPPARAWVRSPLRRTARRVRHHQAVVTIECWVRRSWTPPSCCPPNHILEPVTRASPSADLRVAPCHQSMRTFLPVGTPVGMRVGAWYSMDGSPTDLPHTVHRIAADHGLNLDTSTITVNEMGLDFRVAIARTFAGDDWVLRLPRRPDVLNRAEVEGHVLRTDRTAPLPRRAGLAHPDPGPHRISAPSRRARPHPHGSGRTPVAHRYLLRRVFGEPG